jgi:hypothetical protein
MRRLIQKEFERGASIPVVCFPEDGTAVQDTPRLTLVVVEPESEWAGTGSLRQQIAEWTKQRGKSPRLYPGSLVWCLKKPGRDLRDKVELWLAWRRVAKEVTEGTLGGDFDRSDRAELQSKVTDAEEAAKDEVWGGYRFVVIADSQEPDGLKTIDLGAGHSSAGETLCGRVITALKSQALLNESRSGVYRTQLAAGAQGIRRLAAGQLAAELPERLSYAAPGPRRDPAQQDRRVGEQGRFRACLWPEAGWRL